MIVKTHKTSRVKLSVMFDLQEVRAESGVCVSDEVRPFRITGARRLRVAQAAATYRQSTAAAAPMISLEQTNSVYCIMYHQRTLWALHLLSSYEIHTEAHIFKVSLLALSDVTPNKYNMEYCGHAPGTPRVACTNIICTSAGRSAFSIAPCLPTKLHSSLRE